MMLILPFFLIKLQDSKVTLSNYIKFLKIVIVQNSIGNLIVNFEVYLLIRKYIYHCLLDFIYFKYTKVFHHVDDFI